jgi:hypothetical protein
MRIKLLKGVIVRAVPHAQPGQVYDVPADEANLLIAYGDAIREPDAVIAVETREPEVESREPVAVKQVKRMRAKLP